MGEILLLNGEGILEWECHPSSTADEMMDSGEGLHQLLKLRLVDKAFYHEWLRLTRSGY